MLEILWHSEALEQEKKNLNNDEFIIKNIIRGTLNDQAFEHRKNLIITISSHLTIRDKNNKFVAKHIRVKKVQTNDIDSMRSFSATIRGTRFDGWQSIEEGTEAEVHHIATLEGRRGDITKKLPKGRRLIGDLPKDTDYKGIHPEQSIAHMMRKLSSEKYRKPFIITRKNKLFRQGVYVFANQKKMIMVQTLGRFRNEKIELTHMAGRLMTQDKVDSFIKKNGEFYRQKYPKKGA